MNIEEAKETLKTMKENIDKKYLKARNSLAIETVLSELKKKEAIINEMAEQLAGLAIFDIEKDEPLVLGDKEEVKEYFTKKSEKEGVKDE